MTATDTFAAFFDTMTDTLDVPCDEPRGFTYGGMIVHALTFAAARRVVVLGALESFGITDLDAGDPAECVSRSS